MPAVRNCTVPHAALPLALGALYLVQIAIPPKKRELVHLPACGVAILVRAKDSAESFSANWWAHLPVWCQLRSLRQHSEQLNLRSHQFENFSRLVPWRRRGWQRPIRAPLPHIQAAALLVR